MPRHEVRAHRPFEKQRRRMHEDVVANDARDGVENARMQSEVVRPAMEEVRLAEDRGLFSIEPIDQRLRAAAEARHLAGIERGQRMEYAVARVVTELCRTESHRGTTSDK